jgi:hypothetical protein
MSFFYFSSGFVFLLFAFSLRDKTNGIFVVSQRDTCVFIFKKNAKEPFSYRKEENDKRGKREKIIKKASLILFLSLFLIKHKKVRNDKT